MVRIFFFFILLSLFIASFVDAASFIRGDANQDNEVDISDASFILNWLFLGGKTPQCMDAADVNDDGDVDISDSKYLFGFLFTGENKQPPLPYPLAGEDTTVDKLTCRGESDGIIISSCRTINRPGRYILNGNVLSNDTCFEINASNVTLDCQGYEINYSIDNEDTNTEYGVYAHNVNFTTIKNCKIFGQEGRRGIYFDDVSNGRIFNNSIGIDGHGKRGLVLSATKDTDVVANIIEMGIELDNSPNNRLDSNIVVSGDSGIGVNITASDNVIISNNNVSSSYYGISLESSFFTEIKNNAIDGGVYYGIWSLGSDFGTLQNLNVIAHETALVIDGGNFIVRDSTFTSDANVDIFLDGMINLTNVSFEEAGGTFNRHWYLDVLVKNTSTHLQGVTIRVYDKNNRLLTTQLTDPYGRIPRQTILSYMQINEEEIISYTPHKLVASKTGYKTQSRFVTMDQNRFETFFLQRA